MYIIFNKDGSIDSINLTDYIQQGNNNVNHIFLAIKDREQSEWAATGYFELPSNDVVGLTASQSSELIDGKTYYGYSVPISSTVTLYEGNVKFSISLLNLQSQVLNTYQGTLVINPACVIPDDTTITQAQYDALLQYVLSATQNKALIQNIIFVFDNTSIPDSFSRFNDGQIFFNESNKKFYKLVDGQLVEYVIFNPDNTFLTVEENEYIIPPEDR